MYSGETKTGEVVIGELFHTQAKARVVSGTAQKDAAAREIVAEKKEEKTDVADMGNFRDNGDGTVTDTKTKLIWQKCSIGQNNDATCSGKATRLSWDWGRAKNSCKKLKLAGKKWRLPEKEELKSLIYC